MNNYGFQETSDFSSDYFFLNEDYGSDIDNYDGAEVDYNLVAMRESIRVMRDLGLSLPDLDNVTSAAIKATEKVLQRYQGL